MVPLISPLGAGGGKTALLPTGMVNLRGLSLIIFYGDEFFCASAFCDASFFQPAMATSM